MSGPFYPSAAARRGAIARDNGESFEAWCAEQNREAVAAGVVAWWRHVSPKVVWVGAGRARGGARPKVVGEGTADYVAQLRGGRALVVEAKSTEDPRLGYSALEPQQIEHLDACVAHGGLGILLVELTSGPAAQRFAAPWPVSWTQRGRGASVGATELGRWHVPAGHHYLERFVEW